MLGGLNIQFLVLGMVAMILSITVHEYAHARAAYLLGDDTAARAGRMTLNPIPHIDIIGTIIIPIVAAIAGNIPLIGWAKPVPVMPVLFTRKLSMHKAHAIVAVAGPLSNLFLSLISAIILKILTYNILPYSISNFLLTFFYILFFMNLGLCIFNLIPIPPLDGSKLLPVTLQSKLESIRPVSYFILIAIVYFAGGIISIPIHILATIISKVLGLGILGIG